MRDLLLVSINSGVKSDYFNDRKITIEYTEKERDT